MKLPTDSPSPHGTEASAAMAVADAREDIDRCLSPQSPVGRHYWEKRQKHSFADLARHQCRYCLEVN